MTKDLPFREFNTRESADSALFREILSGRYRLLESEKPIYCTAINPCQKEKKEVSPHDDRPGTVHIVAIDMQGHIACALSVAVDLGEKDRGKAVVLPLENRLRNNSFLEGANQDLFREHYLTLNYQWNRSLGVWEMAELYRHFRSTLRHSDLAARIGLYTGCYHLLIREALKKDLRPTWI